MPESIIYYEEELGRSQGGMEVDDTNRGFLKKREE